MATKPLTSEAIFLAEKKMDMTLDDIIKMSKTRGTKPKKQRVSNRVQQFSNVSQENSLRARRYMDTRSSLRQGALAQRRSNFQGNQFPLATEAAKKAAAAPIRGRAFNRSRKQFNVNKRFQMVVELKAGASNVRKIVGNGDGFTGKKSFIVQKTVQQTNLGSKQKAHTLDSLFANMKEERMRVISRQNNNNIGSRRDGQGQPGVPWARGRHHN